MNKLKLRLDDLHIDSFDTTTPAKSKGTVFGEQCTCYTQCTCPGCPTCYASCNGTCDASCNGTCDATCNGCSDFSCDLSCDGTCPDTGRNTCYRTCQGFETYGAGYDHCILC